MLTALGQNADVVAGLDAGADDYLTKPFPMDVLLARLRALGRRPRTFDPVANATQIRVGDLVIDELQHVVSRGGEQIPLTPREFTLLTYLARHANRALTPRPVDAACLARRHRGRQNVLDTYIHHLRDKLETPGDAPLILTIRGVGYSLRLSEGERPAHRRMVARRGQTPPDHQSSALSTCGHAGAVPPAPRKRLARLARLGRWLLAPQIRRARHLPPRVVG